jgi:sucrose-phosphate synthase
VISSVGANIYYGLDDNLADKGWRQHIAYRWKRNKAIEVIKGFPGLTLQEEANQNSSKISYYVEEDIFNYDDLMQLLGPMTRQLNVILTRGVYLDILPKRASKGRAVRYLAHKWSVPLHQTLVCGDSGNDLDMFAGSTMGVVVGDHAEEMEILRNSKWVHFSNESGPRGVLDGLKNFNFFEKQ